MPSPITVKSRPSRSEVARILGARIRRLRLQRGVSAAALARACGISSAFLSQIENGKRTPKFYDAICIAKELGFPLGDFWD